MQWLELHLPVSKTDSGGRGVVVSIPGQARGLCPVRTYKEWGRRRKDLGGEGWEAQPLFVEKDGRPLTKKGISRRIERWCEAAEASLGITRAGGIYRGHSLRKGGATSLKLQGMSDEDIMTAGRWKSDAYKRYVESGGSQARRMNQMSGLAAGRR